MRPHRQLASRLHGQIVLVDRYLGTIVLDCLLAPSPCQLGSPVMLVVRSPGQPLPRFLMSDVTLVLGYSEDSLAPGLAMKRLRTWAQDAVPIELEVSIDKRRAQVCLRTEREELFFRPEDSAHTAR